MESILGHLGKSNDKNVCCTLRRHTPLVLSLANSEQLFATPAVRPEASRASVTEQVFGR
jgi:hypothetical protein